MLAKKRIGPLYPFGEIRALIADAWETGADGLWRSTRDGSLQTSNRQINSRSWWVVGLAIPRKRVRGNARIRHNTVFLFEWLFYWIPGDVFNYQVLLGAYQPIEPYFHVLYMGRWMQCSADTFPDLQHVVKGGNNQSNQGGSYPLHEGNMLCT